METKLGCHVSNNGSLMLLGSVNEALSYNANCFMLYMGAPQNTFRKRKEEFRIDEYLDVLNKNNISPSDVIVHGPYILNFANPDSEKREFAISFLCDEIALVSAMKSKYIVIHPGSHMNMGSEFGCNLIADSLKKVLEKTKEYDATLLVETMAGKGGECARTFEEVAYILSLVGNDRLQVCLDTCHIFDGGYDIVNDYEGVINEFDRIVGLDHIKCIHLNDSKNVLGSHKDRHENIGFGNIGFDILLKVVNDPRFISVPKILETPYVENEKHEKVYPPYKFEIEMIRSGQFNPDLIKLIVNNSK